MRDGQNQNEQQSDCVAKGEKQSEKDDGKVEAVWYLLSKLSANFVPYLSNFIESILPGVHLEPSLSKYSECIQKGTVLMFDHDILCLFRSYPDLLAIFKLFCQTTQMSADNTSHGKMLSYLRSLCVSHHIECAKHTKSKQANNGKREERDFDFYVASSVIFECLYFCQKISLRLYKMIGMLLDLDLSEMGKLFRHVCTLCLQPVPPQNAINIMAKSAPYFPLKLDQKMLTAEKRVIRQILLQNPELMSKHVDFVAAIFSL